MLFTYLKAFITVASLGSFNKAAEELELTTTAIMKRINKLENEVGAKLLQRANNGVTLTPAGEAFFHDAHQIKRHIEDSILRARHIEKSERTLKIGVTPLTPTNLFMDIWPFINQYNPDLNLELVPLDYVLGSNCSAFHSHTGSVDAMLGAFDEKMLEIHECQGIEICTMPLGLCASENNILTRMDKVVGADLKGCNVRMLKRHPGAHTSLDAAYTKLTAYGATVTEFAAYNIDLLHETSIGSDLLLCFPNILRIYPSLKPVNIDLNLSMSFGVIHDSKITSPLQSFIRAYKCHKDKNI